MENKPEAIIKQLNHLLEQKASEQLQEEVVRKFKYSEQTDLNILNSKSLQIKFLKSHYFFIGQVVNSMLHGKGIYINLKILIIYQGEFESNCRHGFGYLIMPNQSTYKGMFVNNKFHGQGTFQDNNGLYKGLWVNEYRHGYGEFYSPGFSYKGQWKLNKPDGKGEYFISNKLIYQGYFQKGVKEGQGKQTLSNGDSYQGNYKQGKFEGFGVYKWQNGQIFIGNFKTGRRYGHGKWSNQKGDRFEGTYYEDKKNGYGEIYWFSGNIYKGNFFNDLRHGYGQMFWKDRSYYKGEWVQGVQNGKGQLHIVGQNKINGIFKNNLLMTQLQDFVSDKSSAGQKKGKLGTRLFKRSGELSMYDQFINDQSNNLQKHFSKEIQQKSLSFEKRFSTFSQFDIQNGFLNDIPIVVRKKTLQPLEQSGKKKEQRKYFRPYSKKYSIQQGIMYPQSRTMQQTYIKPTSNKKKNNQQRIKQPQSININQLKKYYIQNGKMFPYTQEPVKPCYKSNAKYRSSRRLFLQKSKKKKLF